MNAHAPLSVTLPSEQEPVVCMGFHHLTARAAMAEKIAAFHRLFSVPAEEQALYQPLFLACNFSSSGEIAESFGLFTKDNLLYEVHGSECSVWDFTGQWEPEPTSLAALLHRLDHGSLGQSEYEDNCFHEELREVVQRLAMEASAGARSG
jgi:hypothetical protein